MGLKWRAGAASVRFTPDEPMWLAGYAVRSEPSRGTLSDLCASALALEDAAGQKLVMVSADIIAVPAAIADAAASQVRRRHEIPRGNFVFAATHTHYAPEIRPEKAPFFKIPPDYACKIPQAAGLLVEAMARAAGEALDTLAPARLLAGRASAGFGRNRRREKATAGGDRRGDQVWSRLLPATCSDFPDDPDVPVLDVRAADGKHLAIVFGYACHNLTLDPQDRRYCADWAGFARSHLQEFFPGSTALFIAGCGADQDPEPRGSLELSQAYGRDIGEAVQTCVDSASIEIEPTLHAATQEVELEMRPVTPEWIAEGLASDDPPRKFKAAYLRQRLAEGERLETLCRMPIQAVRLGRQVLMILLGGEPVVDWAHLVRTQFSDGGVPLVWTAGYCNDMCGYIPTLRIQREGGYEGGRATLWSALPGPWDETVEDRVSRAVERLVAHVRQTGEA